MLQLDIDLAHITLIIKQYNFSEAQDGKDACNLSISP